ncbi:MAG: hypothetical protein IPM16_02640 [Chloroflexi bacterium]|nr:hypothetical protein [Chloroflexota bacterium]
MRFDNETDAVTYIFESIAASGWQTRGLDENTREIAPSRALLERLGLPRRQREYAVVTGSKGKGSVTILTARILRELGHRVGTVTSPHLISYRERIRVNGKAIPPGDFLRLVDRIAPAVDAVVADLPAGTYLSPQGIFLALALTWFDENDVDTAVIEVGRGGRFDDNILVPNRLSLFTPMVLEHTRYLGPTIERIAWHKAGILKPGGYGLSLPQHPDAETEIRLEAERIGASVQFLDSSDLGQYVGDWERGVLMQLPDSDRIARLPFYGRYAVDNAGLSLHAAHHLHTALTRPGVSWGDFVPQSIPALEAAIWPGRCEKLGDRPQVFVDGAVNPLSLHVYLDSVRARITHPLVIVGAVPTDRDIEATYRLMASAADHLILTASERNITIRFPDESTALSAARAALASAGRTIGVEFAPDIATAIPLALARAGDDGTVLLTVAQPAVADTMAYFGRSFEQI